MPTDLDLKQLLWNNQITGPWFSRRAHRVRLFWTGSLNYRGIYQFVLLSTHRRRNSHGTTSGCSTTQVTLGFFWTSHLQGSDWSDSCLSYYEISLIHILWCLTVCGTSYDVCEPLIDTCVKLVGCDGSYLAATLTVTLVLQHTTMHKHHFLLLFLCFCFLVHKTDKHSDLQNGLFWDTEYHFLLSKII